MKTKHMLFLPFWCCLMLAMRAPGQTGANPAENEAAAMIRQIYTAVSSDGVQMPDWEKISSCFVEEAVIVLKTSREASTRFTVEEFIQDFKDFYGSPAVGKSGFKEEVLRVNAQVYGDAASIAVVYEASILDSDRPPQKGVDFWLLTRNDQDWKIVAVVNEIIPAGEDIPQMFDPGGP